VPWFRLDIHWYEDEKIEAAAEQGGPLVLSLFPVLLAKAKAQDDGGRVEFTYRRLSRDLFADWEEINPAIEALVSAGVLACPAASERSAVVAFDPVTWRRWQEAQRKAASRAKERELKAA
jgi:hypothetical protein